MTSHTPFPDQPTARDQWILARRQARSSVTADKPYDFFVEQERLSSGEIGDMATVFLTNRECPWRCTMCDLWKHTLTHSVAPGDIPRQLRFALTHLPAARAIKLYNSGSFFDPGAIPREDFPAIASLLEPFERVIVESHPALIGESCLHLRDLISGTLEVAMGLETAHPAVLEKLNKRMTLEGYAAAASTLQHAGIALRSFILVQPPFLPSDDALHWACRSIDFALGCNATAVTLIPTRPGNGATDELLLTGQFSPPSLATLEQALAYGLHVSSTARVFVDLWDIDRTHACSTCGPARLDRLRRANLSQLLDPPVPCSFCPGAAA